VLVVVELVLEVLQVFLVLLVKVLVLHQQPDLKHQKSSE
jgi:hypothetical protein